MKKIIFAGAFLAVLLPFTSFAALDTNLKYGSSGTAVTELQEFLTEQGVYSGPVTGNFYSLTLAGVKAFQAKEGISPVSGYWGPLSRAQAQAKLNLTDSNADEQTETGSVAAPIIQAPVMPVQSQVVTPPIPEPITQTTAVPSEVYSIQVTSPISGSADDVHHYFYAKVGVDNQFLVALYKGPVTISAYEAEATPGQNPNPNHIPVVTAGGGIQLTNNSGVHFINSGNDVGSNYIMYMENGSNNFTIHPDKVGDITVTLTELEHNVTKNILIQAQD